MKGKDLFDAFDGLQDDVILESAPGEKKRKKKRLRFIALTAAAAILITAMPFGMFYALTENDAPDGSELYALEEKSAFIDVSDIIPNGSDTPDNASSDRLIIRMLTKEESMQKLLPRKRTGFSLNSDGKGYTYLGPEVGYKAEEFTIPSEYNGKPVTVVGALAFLDCTLGKVIVPEGVTKICDYAFSLSGVPDIQLPESIRQVEAEAFAGTLWDNGTATPSSYINYLGTKDNTYYLLYSADRNEAVSIHDETRIIASCAFQGMYEDERIYIPDHLLYIDSGALSGLSHLKTIEVSEKNTNYKLVNNCLVETETGRLIFGLPDAVIPTDGSVKVICDSAFRGKAPTEIVIPKGVEAIERWAFSTYSEHAFTLSLPWGLRYIGESAFKGMTIEEISLPYTVKEVHDEAFSDCRISKVSIPCGIVYFGTSVFGRQFPDSIETYTRGHIKYIGNWLNPCVIAVGTDGELSGNVRLPWGVKIVYDRAFKGCSDMITGIHLPYGLRKIGDYAFYSCDGIQKTNIPGSVKSIGVHAFEQCSQLETVNFSKGTISIGENAFANCPITDLLLPSTLEKVDRGAFCVCPVKELYIPKSLVSIAPTAFTTKYYSEEYPALEKITVHADNPVYISRGNCLIEKATGTLILGCINSEIPDDGSILKIGESAFEYCRLSEITLPEGILEILPGAFRYCRQLTSVTLPQSLQSIGKEAFYDCSALQTVNLSDNLASIGENSFYHCAITKIDIPGNVEIISHSAFYCCEQLRELTLHEGLKVIGQNAFGYTDVEDLRLPESVCDIQFYAFANCDFTELYIPAGVTRIVNGAFYNITLEHISVCKENPYYESVDDCLIERGTGRLLVVNKDGIIPGDGRIKCIPPYAFCGIKGLESLEIPDGVETVDDPFCGCDDLCEIIIPKSVRSISLSAFSGLKDHTCTIIYKGTKAEWEQFMVFDLRDRNPKLTLVFED